MKRIEIVIENATLDRFTEAARALQLDDFDVTEVRRAPSTQRQNRQRLYRGHEYAVDLVDRLKVDLNVADTEAEKIARTLLTSVNPESIMILRLDPISPYTERQALDLAPVAPRESAASALH
ncbi:MAG TPA: P-II family nitrogen regulator [Candidatus Binataceae bacterium]|nr:P-II family nitrogen regulator [Candidatus Binataceae bacterium]